MHFQALDAVLAAAARQDDVVLSREALRLGLTRRELEYLQSARIQPLVRGAVAIPPVRDPLRSSARAAQLAVPHGVISHATAARLHGLQGLDFWDPSDQVHLMLPPSRTRHQRRGVRLHFCVLDDADVVQLGGMKVTSVARTLLDLAALTDRMRYICLVDNALNQERFDAAGLAWLLDSVERIRPEAVNWLALVDGRSESPSETRVRVVLTDGGLAPDDLQIVVYDEHGVPIARLDMGYMRAARRVGLEVDSAEHERPRALYRDRDKHNAYRGRGWDVRQVTAYDSRKRPAYLIEQVRDALGLR